MSIPNDNSDAVAGGGFEPQWIDENNDLPENNLVNNYGAHLRRQQKPIYKDANQLTDCE